MNPIIFPLTVGKLSSFDMVGQPIQEKETQTETG